ncbi:indole-3-glycerol phosphate synthase TrpC [Virgibacillus sp. W0430]|uniref:indole-3-glycerol phosphate synthase TrpC n=1 Tax=Virgibacillus sp. W0430 TaxID=3391580 RepID=UPI003F471201
MSILDKILKEKKKEIEILQNQTFSSSAHKNVPTLHEQIKGATQISIIAEIKRASPSKGNIHMNVDPVQQAKQYEACGASAISVLTDKPFFHGTMDDLIAVRHAVDIPILCKDFIIDKIQIDQAKAAGANIILLIVAALDQEDLTTLYQYALNSGLEILVEVHNESEMERALQLEASIIGINNRDLKTFNVDLETTDALASMVTDPNTVIISESGIQTRGDVLRVENAGAKAILVGETLMRAEDVKETFTQLQIPLR